MGATAIVIGGTMYPPILMSAGYRGYMFTTISFIDKFTVHYYDLERQNRSGFTGARDSEWQWHQQLYI